MQVDGGILSNQATNSILPPPPMNDMSDSDRRNNTTNTFVNKEHMRGQVCIRADDAGRGCYPQFGANNIEGSRSRPLQIPTEMVNYAINEDSHLSSNLDTYKYMMTPAKRVRHVWRYHAHSNSVNWLTRRRPLRVALLLPTTRAAPRPLHNNILITRMMF